MIVALGFVAFLLNVVANLMLATKNSWGWILRLVSNVAWIAYAIHVVDGEPMVLNHIVFFGINVFAFWNWRRLGDAK